MKYGIMHHVEGLCCGEQKEDVHNNIISYQHISNLKSGKGRLFILSKGASFCHPLVFAL